MQIDRETISTTLQIFAVLVLPTISMVYTWIATRDKDNSQHIKAVEKALGDVIAQHASRIDRLESDAEHAPSQADFAKLMADMQGVKSTQDAIHRELHAQRLTSNRIEDFLLKR